MKQLLLRLRVQVKNITSSYQNATCWWTLNRRASPVHPNIVATLIHSHRLCHGNDRPLVEKRSHYRTPSLCQAEIWGIKMNWGGNACFLEEKLTLVATYGAASFWPMVATRLDTLMMFPWRCLRYGSAYWRQSETSNDFKDSLYNLLVFFFFNEFVRELIGSRGRL